MTSQSAIFDRRVNPIAPEEASLKSIFNKIYLKIPTPYRWTSWKCILTNQKTVNQNFKICYFACNNPVRIQNSLPFALSLMVYKIMANLLFRGHVTLRVMWPKNQKFQNLLFCMQLLCKGNKFAPFRGFALTVYEITANLNKFNLSWPLSQPLLTVEWIRQHH